MGDGVHLCRSKRCKAKMSVGLLQLFIGYAYLSYVLQ
jgi:hypothetical protein